MADCNNPKFPSQPSVIAAVMVILLLPLFETNSRAKYGGSIHSCPITGLDDMRTGPLAGYSSSMGD